MVQGLTPFFCQNFIYGRDQPILFRLLAQVGKVFKGIRIFAEIVGKGVET